MGKILRVNLSDKSYKVESVPEELYRKFIGARGLAAYLLFKEMKPGVDPLGPDNKVIWATGPLTGVPYVQTSHNGWVSVCKSPLTGCYLRNRCMSKLGRMLKACGYDAVIFEGTAEKPTYVYITEDGVTFGDASTIWGATTDLAQHILREHMIMEPRAATAAIGPAGEKLVKVASVQCETRQLGRGGIGAVLGAKKLKAVAVYGTKPVPVADMDKVKELVREQVKQLAASAGAKRMQKFGTCAIHALINELGDYPYKNFWGTYYPDHLKLKPEERLARTIRHAGCPYCLISCWKYTYVKEGPFAGTWCDGPEYETAWSYGGFLAIDDFNAVIAGNYWSDMLGVDTISTGVIIGFAIELFEKGILTKEDTDGLELRWGDPFVMLELIRRIAYREGKLGDILAEGVKKAAEKIGKGADYYAIHCKGLEWPGYDPRPTKAHGLTICTSNIGASHALGYSTQEVFGLPEKVDGKTIEGKGKLTKYNQDRLTWGECCIWCTFPTRTEWHKPALLCSILAAVTGIEEFASWEYALLVGERVWNVERCFNVREGFTRKDDYPPERLMKEPVPEGPAAGCTFTKEEVDKMLDEYYTARGWDVATGIPTKDKLVALELSDIADELAKLGRLP